MESPVCTPSGSKFCQPRRVETNGDLQTVVGGRDLSDQSSDSRGTPQTMGGVREEGEGVRDLAGQSSDSQDAAIERGF